MDGSIQQVLREFGLKSGDMRKERNQYVCQTDKGLVMIKQVRLDADALSFIHYTKEKLSKAGFAKTDRYITTEDGLPYVDINGEPYVAVRHFIGKESSFGDIKQYSSIIKTISRMHGVTCRPGFYDGFEGDPRRNREIAAVFSQDGFNKQLKVMRGYKKMALRQGRLSDFDVFFLKNIDGFERRINKSLEIWESMRIDAYFGRRAGFAHNAIKEETALVRDGEVYITGFDECSTDSFVYDLASVIKRHLRSGGSMPLGETLETYARGNPVSETELQALRAILLAPDKFYKTSIKYYSKKRTWTPASFGGVMEDLNGGWDLTERYVSNFFGVS